MSAWYEDDDFWMAFYPAMFHAGRWADATGEVQAALALLGVDAPVEVLDFCCGPGRHAIALAQLGHRVVGVDRTAPYLKIAQKKAEAAGVSMAFERADVRHFRRDGAFDAAVSLYTSFGYFDDPEDDRKVLENIHASLKSGGKGLLDMMGKEVIARTFQSRSWSEPEPGMLFLEERAVENGWERIANRWVLLREGKQYEKRFALRMYSGVELKALMLAVGFGRVELYGSLSGDPYDQNARRLVAVGIKP